ncbi:MAG: lamin tail domain-containing protein, partial [Calditrichota bacterium]
MSYAPLGAEPEDQITIQIIVKNVGLFVMQDSLLLYKQNLMVSNPDSLQEIRRWFTGALQPGDTNSFVHEWTIPDDSLHVFVSRLLSTDDNHTNNEWVMMVNPGGTAGWIVINEIMYQPEPLRAEWVEIYNSGVSTWSGVGWSFGDGTGIEDTTRRCNFADVVLAPSRYLVIASDSSIYFENVPVESPIVVWNDSPISLNNSGDSLFLYDNYGQITDRVDYRPSWGNGQAGVSIERISAASSSNDPTNWAASLDSTGATPGRINSRVLPEFQSVTDLLVLEPNPFSPDGDGHDDILAVRFALDHADSRLDLKIYEVRGREVRRLANNEAAGYMGERLWDGKDNNGRELPTGIYIVYLEALGKGGTRIQSTKRVVALARRS